MGGCSAQRPSHGTTVRTSSGSSRSQSRPPPATRTTGSTTRSTLLRRDLRSGLPGATGGTTRQTTGGSWATITRVITGLVAPATQPGAGLDLTWDPPCTVDGAAMQLG